MNKTEIQPGFLQAYRMFVATRIVFWVVIGPILVVLQLAQTTSGVPLTIPSMNLVERLTLPNLAPILLVEVILLILLFAPQAARLLGKWYVPVVLLIGLGPLLVGYYWWPSENPLQTPFVIFFFGMLVLVAWQYPFRYVLAYATQGGNDVAKLYDSEGKDTLIANPDLVKLYNGSFFNQAKYFRNTYSYSTAGGYDSAYLYDSALEQYPDHLETGTDWVRLSNKLLGYAHWLTEFEEVTVTLSNESDTKDVDPDALDFILYDGS